MDHDGPAGVPPFAPSYTVPTRSFAGIEYVGPVNSVPRALASLGGLPNVSAVLAAPASSKRVLELNLNPGNAFFHPIPAAAVDSANVLLKVVTRKRRRPRLDEDGRVVEVGKFTIDPVGVVDKTVRFRSMADFQYSPVVKDPVVAMADALRGMDVEAIQSFTFPAPDEVFTTPDIFLPPPVFSRQNVPHLYDYRPAAGSVPTFSSRASGEEAQRLVNFGRLKAVAHRTVPFAIDEVPTAPDEELTKSRNPAWASLEEKLHKILEKRPVWLRTGLVNQLTPEEQRIVNNHKQIIYLVSYTFSDGPFRELVIRFGFDPRKDDSSRLYQRIAFRNQANIRSKKDVTGKGKAKEKEIVSNLSHTFDGVSVHSKIGNFQFCDISDPLAKSLIESRAGVLAKCSSEPEGWYDPDYFEQIRQVVRRKWTGIHNGVVVTNEDCEDLLGDPTVVKWRKAKQGKGKSADAGSASEASHEEGNGSEGDGGASGSGNGSDATGGRTRRKPAKKYVKRAPWEGSKKKTYRAKVPTGSESVEAKAERLRKAIGLAPDSGPSSRATTQAMPEDVGSGEEDAEDEGSEDGSS